MPSKNTKKGKRQGQNLNKQNKQPNQQNKEKTTSDNPNQNQDNMFGWPNRSESAPVKKASGTGKKHNVSLIYIKGFTQQKMFSVYLIYRKYL